MPAFFMGTILYICGNIKYNKVKKKITLSSSNTTIAFAKKYAREKKSSVSELFNHYLETLRNIESANKSNKKKDPFIDKFAGVFDTGSKDILKELFGK